MAAVTAEEIIRLLDLQPNATCGFVRVTFLSKAAIAPGALPMDEPICWYSKA
jgi:uncharacterized protein